MSITEDLEWVVLTQGAGLPGLYIDLEDSDGELVDLSTLYDTFTAKIVTDDGIVSTVAPTVTGVTTGFYLIFGTADTAALAADEYLVQAKARRIADNRYRYAKCRLQVVTGY